MAKSFPLQGAADWQTSWSTTPRTSMLTDSNIRKAENCLKQACRKIADAILHNRALPNPKTSTNAQTNYKLPPDSNEGAKDETLSTQP